MKLLLTVAAFSVASFWVSAQNVPSYIPRNGLVGYYPLSKSDGLNDRSGNRINGVGESFHIKDRVSYSFNPAPDRFGDSTGAMNFHSAHKDVSADDQFSITPPQGQKFSQGFSLGGWQLILFPTFPQSFLSKDHTDKICAFELLFDHNPNRFCLTAEGDSVVSLTSKGLFYGYGWHALFGTFDGSTLRLYIDGELEKERVLSGSDLDAFRRNIDAGGAFRVGYNVTSNVYNGTGAAEDLLIYNRALTPAEVRQLFFAGGKIFQRKNLKFDINPQTIEGVGIYPDVVSAVKPGAAAAMNKALQMSDFGKIKTAKNPSALIPTEPGVMLDYVTAWPTSTLLVITTSYARQNMQSRGGELIASRTTSHYFDMTTGDVSSVRDFFTPSGYDALTATLKKRTGQDLTTARIDVNAFTRQLTFQFDQGVDDPVISIPLSLTETNPALSEKGKYYFADGPMPDTNNSFAHTWTCVLGNNIPVTMVIESVSNNAVKGMEVYNNYGTVIPMKGLFTNGLLKLDELDDKGNAVGSFEVSIADRKLTGKWTNKDSSKTFPFRAVVAGD